MASIDLRYGSGSVALSFAEERFQIIGTDVSRASLSDPEIGERLDSPFDSSTLEDLVEPGQSVLIVVPDATRQAAAGQIVNLVVRRLIGNGIQPYDIRIIFATGIHRKVTEAEKAAILTPFILQRVKTLDHDPRDLTQLARLGETTGGIPVELNQALLQHDHVVLVGAINFHYFAGFTGGRKLICPGLASGRTTSETHRLAFDCDARSRRDGVGPGLLDGNPVHEAFVAAAELIKPPFAINTIVNERGECVDLYCGHWLSSHRAACDSYAEAHSADLPEKRPLVIVSCGGSPHDLNLIQAHKALDSASSACSDGGTVILLAECSDGLGRDDLMKWFAHGSSTQIAEALCSRYQVNGQTAWNMKRIAESYDVKLVTEIDEGSLAQMGIGKREISDLAFLDSKMAPHGYIMPNGAKTLIRSVSNP